MADCLCSWRLSKARISRDSLYDITLVGQTKAAVSLQADTAPLAPECDVSAFVAGSIDGEFFEPTQQIIFGKIFKQVLTMNLFPTDLLPITPALF
jgi:hypothetical protein